MSPSPENQETILSPAPASEGGSASSMAEEILKSFQAPINRVKVSPLYQLGLVIVAAVMILLPLIYLFLIGSFGFYILHYAFHDYPILFPNLIAPISIFVRIGPVTAGIILIIFMIKPFFAKQALIFKSIEVKAEDEPLLFEFVQKVCQATHTPAPGRIEVDCRVNAMAGFGRGAFSILRRKLVLTIGLPLLANLDLREFAGVLSHEFGHSSQGAAMRVSFLINNINRWFLRVVYERDAWDEWLSKHARGANVWMTVTLQFASLMVWIVRKILWLLMTVGHLVSCYMSRQMEFNADQHQIRLVGSDAFMETMRKLRLLEIAFQNSMNDLDESWREKRLVDDVAELVTRNVQAIPLVTRLDIYQQILRDQTSLFDTHPSIQARFQRAEQEDSPGVHSVEVPALELLKDYPKLARLTSIIYYKTLLERDFDPEMMLSTEEIVERRGKTAEEQRALSRYFQDACTNFQLPIMKEAAIQCPENFQHVGRELTIARKQLWAELADAQKTCKLLEEKCKTVVHAEALLALRKARFRIAAQDLNLPEAGERDIIGLREEAKQYVASCRQRMKDFNSLAERRMLSALKLLHNEKIREQMGDNFATPLRAQQLYSLLAALGRGYELIHTLNQQFTLLSVLLKRQEDDEDNAILNSYIENQLRASHKYLEDISTMFQEFTYPFDHASGKITLSRYLVGGLPHATDIEVMYKAKQTLDNYFHLFLRLLGRLAQIAESVEIAGGLKPWLDPQASERQLVSNDEQPELSQTSARVDEHSLLRHYSQKLADFSSSASLIVSSISH